MEPSNANYSEIHEVEQPKSQYSTATLESLSHRNQIPPQNNVVPNVEIPYQANVQKEAVTYEEEGESPAQAENYYAKYGDEEMNRWWVVEEIDLQQLIIDSFVHLLFRNPSFDDPPDAKYDQLTTFVHLFRNQYLENQAKAVAEPDISTDKDWNREFQDLIVLADSKSKFEKIRDLASDFAYCAKTYGLIIISEHSLPAMMKTIKPVNIGGIAVRETI